jgi:hypothetical protein
MPSSNTKGDGGSAAQKRRGAPLSETVRARKNSSTPIASDKGAPDKSTKVSNRNLAQGQQTDDVRTVTSYFDPVWNAFLQHTDGSMQWWLLIKLPIQT